MFHRQNQKQLPKNISNALKQQFPIPETKSIIHTEFRIAKQKQDIQKSDEFTEWSFLAKDGNKSLSLQKSAIYLKVTKYDSFQKVKKEFMTGVNVLFDTYQETQAKRLGLRFVNEIEIALTKTGMENEPEDFPVERCQRGADKKENHAPHQIGVHDARRLILSGNLSCEHAKAYEIAQARRSDAGSFFKVELALPDLPEPNMTIEPIGKDQCGHQAANVQGDLQPVGDVPKGGATNYIGGTKRFFKQRSLASRRSIIAYGLSRIAKNN